MNERIQELKEHLTTLGRDRSYDELASMYEITNSYGVQSGEKVRSIWRAIKNKQQETKSFDSELKKEYKSKAQNTPITVKKEGLHIVLGCMHMPFHNKLMFDSILYFIKDNSYQISGLHLIGDILDMHSISRHSEGRITIPGLSLSNEYEIASNELNKLDKALPKGCVKTYLWGNHEDWYNQYMSKVDNNKLGKDVVKSPTEALDLIEKGYHVQESWRDGYIKLGDIEVFHGEFVGSNAAKKAVDVMKRNTMFVHSHRLGSYSESGYTAHNIGWCGDVNHKTFGYMHRVLKENWANGFAIVAVDPEGISHVTQIQWKNNKFYFGGKEY